MVYICRAYWFWKALTNEVVYGISENAFVWYGKATCFVVKFKGLVVHVSLTQFDTSRHHDRLTWVIS